MTPEIDKNEPPSLSHLVKAYERDTVPKHKLLSELINLKKLNQIISTNRLIHAHDGKTVPSSGENLVL